MTTPGEDDDIPTGGTGDGGTTGTPSDDLVSGPAGGEQTGMVVSGGGLANPDEDAATAAGDRGLG